MEPLHIVFVCLGNICRSPLGEGIFRRDVEAAGLSDRFVIDSAGTSAHHVGEGPDPGSVRVASKHGINIAGQRSRQFCAADLETFHYIIAMDQNNRRNILRLAGDVEPLRGRIWMMRNFEHSSEGDGDDVGVPDPWGGGPSGFDNVFQVVERSSANLLRYIRDQHSL